MNPFSTHLPTLKFLINEYNIQSVFEFGCGLYSTKLFIEKCKTVYSCEMQSFDWYLKVKNSFTEQNNLTINYFEEIDNPNLNATFKAIDYLRSLNTYFDMVFVDGHKDSRWTCINNSAKYTNIIVTHDTEDKQNYHWDRIKLDNDWKRYDVTNIFPHTTYWIKT